MISQENYDILKEKYGDASSWAVWNTDYADSKPSRNINDLSRIRFPESVRIEHRLRVRGAEPLR